MQTHEVVRCLPSGWGRNRASTHCDNMVVLHSGNPGVVSMDSQVETVQGPQPPWGPLVSLTLIGVSDPEHVTGKGQE